LQRNCLLKQVIEGKIKGEIEVKRRRGRRRKKLLDELKDTREYSHLKEEALDRTMWRNCVGRRVGTVVRQITERKNESFRSHFGHGVAQPLSKMSTRNISWEVKAVGA
jgi:hypothetical protein